MQLMRAVYDAFVMTPLRATFRGSAMLSPMTGAVRKIRA